MIFNNDIIEFYCDPKLYDVIPKPSLASKNIPDWYKKIKPTDSQNRNSSGSPMLTAKKCLPLMDSMCLGYTIPLQADVYVITNHDCSIIKASPVTDHCPFKIIEQHGYNQVQSNSWPLFKQNPIKFINYWNIKTAPGWSCLIVHPINHLNTNFQCLSAVVDTDKYNSAINFPAVWLTPNFDGKILAGTPLVQIIPFKRNTFNNTIKVRKMTVKEIEKNEILMMKQRSREHVYTEELRAKR